jgi:hypothetical protein
MGAWLGLSVVLLSVAIVILGPFATLWMLNTLFGMGLAYSWTNWLAALVLGAFFGKTSTSYKK